MPMAPWAAVAYFSVSSPASLLLPGGFMRMDRFVASLCLVVALGLAVPAGSAEEPPVFGSDVSLVLLPVFVSDGDGRAMRGLQPEDFAVREDGKPVEVVSFRYVDATDAEEQQGIRLASAARRRFVLLFDLSFTDPGGLHRAQAAAADFVRRRLQPSDLASVATFDVRRGIRLVANFSEDRALLVHAVMSLGVPQLSKISDPLGLAADLGITDLTRGGNQDDSTPQPLLDNVLGVLARRMRSAEEAAYKQNIATLIGSFEDLARALANVDGRKQVVYLSAGFDARLLVGQWGSEQQAAADSVINGRLWEVDGLTRYGDSQIRDELMKAMEHLSRSDALIHAVDVTGLGGTDDSMSRTGVQSDFSRNTQNRQALNVLAAETGGRFFREANDLKPALAEMLEMTSRYYVLGFQPLQEKGPGEFHKVEVKVARKGARLSHRPGYFERAAAGGQTALQQQFSAAQLVMTGVGRNDLKFSSLCLPFPERGIKQTLGLVIQVPKESLHWQADEPTGVELYGYAVAKDGSVADHMAHFARIDPSLADPNGEARGLSFYGTLSVPPGDYTLRLMLNERETGAAGVQFIDVTVPPYDERAGFLLPPVLVDDSGRWLGMRVDADEEGRRYPFQIEGEAFLPRADFSVQGGRPERMVLLAFEPRLRRDPAVDLQIRSSLTDREGAFQPAGRLRVERVLHDQPGQRTYVLTYTPDDALSDGDYTLRVAVGEGGEQLESYALIRMRSGS